jgi:hypothetical protein
MVFVGVGGVGTFNHTGGTNSCSTLFIGSLNNILSLDLHTGDWNGGGQGTYNLSNGLVVADEEDMAQYGQAGFATVPTGIFNQTGGTNTINARLVMGDDTMGGTAQATYNLAGVLLRLPQMQLNGGNNSTINFSGGTLQAIPGTYHNTSLDIAVPVVVGTAASNVATFDANDMTINLNAYGALTGPGQLRVIDSAGGGTVILGGGGIINAYSGGTTVLSGTLEALNNQALPGTGVLTVAGAASIVLSSHVGTLFESSSAGPAATVGSAGVEIANFGPAADAAGALVPAVATDMGVVAVAGSPTAVPEPSALALLGAGLMSLLTLARRHRRARFRADEESTRACSLW